MSRSLYWHEHGSIGGRQGQYINRQADTNIRDYLRSKVPRKLVAAGGGEGDDAITWEPGELNRESADYKISSVGENTRVFRPC